jgi:hypothetical protein
MRMNQFANLLKTKRIGRRAIEGPDIESDIEEGEKEEAHKFQEELETLLKNFDEEFRRRRNWNGRAIRVSLPRNTNTPTPGPKQKFQDMSSRTLLPRRKLHPNQEAQNIGTVDEPHADKTRSVKGRDIEHVQIPHIKNATNGNRDEDDDE